MRHYCVAPSRTNRALEQFFNDFVAQPFGQIEPNQEFVPRVNVSDSADSLRLTFELSGIDRNDIKIFVKDNVLTVSGERKFESSDEKEGVVRREIRSGSFSRSFTLPDQLNLDKIGADFKNGLLDISIPKLEEAKPKEIEVKLA